MAALVPFLVFVASYAACALLAGSCDKIPMTVSIALAGAVAIFTDRGKTYMQRIGTFTRGMADPDLMFMALIFALAGSFAAVTRASGAVDAVVALARAALPSQAILAGLFLVSCALSLALGTSCGTIAALMGVAAGFAGPAPLTPGMLAGAVVGGAMFGDNLSMISDTTVAVARTLHVGMRDKFLANLAIAVPAALACTGVYAFIGLKNPVALSAPPVSLRTCVNTLPYALVFVLALAGMDVLPALALGIVVTLVLGVAFGSFDLVTGLAAAGTGMEQMSGTLIIALLAFGLIAIVRERGGLDWLVAKLSRFGRGVRSCECVQFALVALLDLVTANNTVAILIAGPIARTFAERHRLSRVRLASIIDTASCIVQGLLPYGGQILIAVGVSRAAGLTLASGDIIAALYYPPLLALAAFAAIGMKRGNRP